jgi:hypothetical protein
MQSYTCHTSSSIMAYRRPLSLTKGPSLWHNFWSNYKTVWALILSAAQYTMCRLMDRPSEQTKSLKNMLHACLLNDSPKWYKDLPLAELSYNNSYQENIKMSHLKHSMDDPVIRH